MKNEIVSINQIVHTTFIPTKKGDPDKPIPIGRIWDYIQTSIGECSGKISYEDLYKSLRLMKCRTSVSTDSMGHFTTFHVKLR